MSSENELERQHKNLRNRRRRCEVTLFRKAHKLHEKNDCEVYVVVHHTNDDHYYIYNSEPSEDWPPPFEKLRNYYPRPEINTPSRPGETLMRGLKMLFGHARRSGPSQLDPAPSSPCVEQDIDELGSAPSSPCVDQDIDELGSPIQYHDPSKPDTCVLPDDVRYQRAVPLEFEIPVPLLRRGADDSLTTAQVPRTPRSGSPLERSPPPAPRPQKRRRLGLLNGRGPSLASISRDMSPSRRPRDGCGRFIPQS